MTCAPDAVSAAPAVGVGGRGAPRSGTARPGEPAGVIQRCSRCGHALHANKPFAVQRTWACVIAAAVLYIPANALPVMMTTSALQHEEHTLLGGIHELWLDGSWGLAAIVFIASSGLADACDGIVARIQNKGSRFGDFLDHCADRAGDSLLAACWLASNGVRIELAMAGIIMTMLNGYIGTQIEATYGVRSYESVGRGEFVLAIIVLPIISYILFTNGWSTMHFAGLTIAEWLAALLLVAAVFGVVQRFRVAARLERS